MKPVESIRIIDPHVIRCVEDYRIKNGDSTATRAAARLILERLAQIEAAELQRAGIRSENVGTLATK